MTVSMNDFQSNYPRGNRPYILPEFPQVNSSLVRKSGIWCCAAAVITAIVMLHFAYYPPLETKAYDDELAILDFLGAAMGFLILIWMQYAIRSVCGLRYVKTLVKPEYMAMAAAVPLVLVYVPLWISLDFVVIRSQSADKPTMKWYLPVSRSLSVNVCALSLGASAVTLLLWADGRDQNLLQLFAGLNAMGLLLFTMIVWGVSRRIVELDKERNANAPPVMRR